MIIGIHGILGTYKTWLLTALGVYSHENNQRIYTNYTINIPHTPLDLDQILTTNMQLFNCTVLIDEIEMYFDARRSMANTIDTYFVFQARKRGVDVLYSSPKRRGMVELRLRDQTNRIFLCDKGNKLYPEQRNYLKFTVIDLDEEKIYRMYINNPKPVFPYFDSYQLLMPKGMGFSEKEMEKAIKALP